MENQETALFKATNELKFFTVKELRIFKNLLSASKKNCSAKEQNEFGQMIVNMVNPSLKKHDLPYKIREKMSETQKGIQKLSPKTQNIIGILISEISNMNPRELEILNENIETLGQCKKA